VRGSAGASARETRWSNAPRAWARDHPLAVARPQSPRRPLGPILRPSWHGQRSDVAPGQLVGGPMAHLRQDPRATALQGAWARRAHREQVPAVAGCPRGCASLFADAGRVALRGQPPRGLAGLNGVARCHTASPIAAVWHRVTGAISACWGSMRDGRSVPTPPRWPAQGLVRPYARMTGGRCTAARDSGCPRGFTAGASRVGPGGRYAARMLWTVISPRSRPWAGRHGGCLGAPACACLRSSSKSRLRFMTNCCMAGVTSCPCNDIAML